MPHEFYICQKEIDEATLKALPKKRRNQIVACMHVHNELSVLNRLLGFSLNDVGEGELHNHAQGVQMWTVMQLLAGKLCETWKMLYVRFLKSNPVDPAIAALKEAHREDLAWLHNYFSSRDSALSIIRDKSSFHYDKDLDVDEAVADVSDEERRVYLAQHPINGLYYLGSSLVFRTVFAMIADKSGDTSNMSQIERMQKGVKIALADLNKVNLHFNGVLSGIISTALDAPEVAPLAKPERLLIAVIDAPKMKSVGLPMFVNIDARRPFRVAGCRDR
jgi:hypothetical protein